MDLEVIGDRIEDGPRPFGQRGGVSREFHAAQDHWFERTANLVDLGAARRVGATIGLVRHTITIGVDRRRRWWWRWRRRRWRRSCNHRWWRRLATAKLERE